MVKSFSYAPCELPGTAFCMLSHMFLSHMTCVSGLIKQVAGRICWNW